jgi:5-guanidino-2-oxopentanoate decarboxylase
MSLTARPIGCYVAELLAANGIDTVFGIPGVHTLELYRGLAREPRLRHILTRHEQGAGFAADGYARASGRPAAAFVISGPGITNILTAVAQAYSDSVPMLVVASTPVRASLGRRWGVLHELADQQGVIGNVLDLACTAASAEDIRDHLLAVLQEFQTGRPRPAYLGIPLDLLAEPTTLVAARFQFTERHRQTFADEIEQAAALLSAAQRPAIIAGGGARAAAGELRQLIETLDGYLMTTAAGKGVLPEVHRCNLGASLPYAETQQLLAQADVVLAVGTEMAETDLYTAMKLTIPGMLIRIDIAAQLNDQYPAAVSIRCDARSAVAALVGRVTSRARWCSLSGGAAPHRSRIDAKFDAAAVVRRRALAAIRAALPADAAVFSDMTQIAYLGNYAFAVDVPGIWHHPSGYGTLGYALPAALGAKVAMPARAVVALAGDFGVQFTLPDLTTAVELGLNLPVVVWNNAALGQIKDDMVAAKIAPVGVVARNPDFIALAQACGAQAQCVRRGTELTAAIVEALRRHGPTLIEVNVAEFTSN